MSRLMKLIGLAPRRAALAEDGYRTLTLAEHREMQRIKALVSLPYTPPRGTTRPVDVLPLAAFLNQEAN